MLRMFNATVASNRFKSTLIITLALLLMLNFTRLIARVSSPYKVLGEHPNASWSSSSSSSSLVAHISDRAPPRQLGSKRSKVFNTFSCFYGGWHLLFFIVLPSFPLLALSPSLSLSLISFSPERMESPSALVEERRRNDSQSALSDVRLGGPREKNPINQ